MSAKPYFMTLASKRLILISLAFSILMVVAVGCNLPGSEPEEAEGPVDPDAQRYRMYYDGSTNGENGELQIRYFDGQIRMADTQVIFGDTNALPIDVNGNRVGGPLLKDGLRWSMVVSPSGAGVNLVSEDWEDGMISSAIDLDGDGIADIVDIRLGDGRRFTFVTEGLGMEVFEGWLLGQNPFCNNEFAPELDLGGFGCPDDAEGGGGGGPGGGGVAAVPGGYVDPIVQMCEEYAAGTGRFNPSRASRAGYRNTSETRVAPNGSYFQQITSVELDEDKNVVSVHRFIHYFDSGDTLTRQTSEFLDADGNGSRDITDIDDEGRDTYRFERIRAFLDDFGNYKSYQTIPPAENPNTSDPPEDDETLPAEEEDVLPPEPPPEDPDDPNPGPEGGDEFGIEEFCIRSYVSGVEHAAATDQAAFQLSCDDLVGAPAGGGDCMIIGWARPGDFQGALEPGEDDDCDDFYERGQGGDCEPTSTLEILRGRTALMASINFEFVPICPPITCNPNPVEAEAQQEISASSEAPGPLVTETPTPTPAPSSVGTIPDLTLCYWGPGAAWGTVSSLNAGLEVEIVGIGEGNGWLIVVNPNFEGVTCWVDEDDVEVPPNLELGSLPEFEIPPLPDVPPEEGGDGSGGDGAADPSAPNAPSGLQTNTIFGNPCKVELDWNDNSNNENGFRIYRDGVLKATVGANVTQFTDNNATETNGYTYSVRAYNAAGESSTTSAASATCFG